MVRVLSLIVLVGGILVLGCGGPSKPPSYAVTGKVTLDGKPLPEGTIYFATNPPDGKAPAHAPIKNGEYSAQVPAGTMLVRISFEKMVKTPMGNATMDIPTETIPARYNRESTLTREVKQGGPNQLDFELKSR